MYAVEFQTRIKNGIIEIPEEFRDRFREYVRVILLAEEKKRRLTQSTGFWKIH